MGFFDFLKTPDINAGVAQFRCTDDAVLLDVRTTQEYAGGHIPGSINIPLQRLEQVEVEIESYKTPIFVYCQSGARSRQAANGLKSMGYTAVTDLGGIIHYRGKVESGV